jgi:hypothetical protein
MIADRGEPCVIAVAGGDGTLNEVLNGLFLPTASGHLSRVTVVVLATGSSNGVAKSLGLLDLEDAGRLLGSVEAEKRGKAGVDRFNLHVFEVSLVEGFDQGKAVPWAGAEGAQAGARADRVGALCANMGSVSDHDYLCEVKFRNLWRTLAFTLSTVITIGWCRTHRLKISARPLPGQQPPSTKWTKRGNGWYDTEDDFTIIICANVDWLVTIIFFFLRCNIISNDLHARTIFIRRMTCGAPRRPRPARGCLTFTSCGASPGTGSSACSSGWRTGPGSMTRPTSSPSRSPRWP